MFKFLRTPDKEIFRTISGWLFSFVRGYVATFLFITALLSDSFFIRGVSMVALGIVCLSFGFSLSTLSLQSMQSRAKMYKDAYDELYHKFVRDKIEYINDMVDEYLNDSEIENHTVTVDDGGHIHIKIGDENNMVAVPLREKEGDFIAAMEAAVMDWRAKRDELET